MTAVVSEGDLGSLRALARYWRGRDGGVFRAVLYGRCAAQLETVLDGISRRRAAGGDKLAAAVHGDSIPELHAAALAKAGKLYGPDAVFAVESTGIVHAMHDTSKGLFYADVRVRCLNYAEIEQQIPEVTS